MVVSVNRHFSGILMQSVILAAVALLSKRDINWIVRQFNFCLSVRCEAYIQLFRNHKSAGLCPHIRRNKHRPQADCRAKWFRQQNWEFRSEQKYMYIHFVSDSWGVSNGFNATFESRGKRPVSITIWQCIKCVDEFAQFIADYDSLCDLSFDALVLRISLAVQTVE
jgi:hypothetical protein